MTNLQMVLMLTVPIAVNMTMFLYVLGRLDRIQESLAALSERVAKLETAMTSLTERVTKLETGLYALVERITKLETAMDRLNEYRGSR